MSETASLPLAAPSPANYAVRLLKERLTAFRRSQEDLSAPNVPAADLYLLAGQFRRRRDPKIAAAIAATLAEIDAELAAVMPAPKARPRRYA